MKRNNSSDRSTTLLVEEKKLASLNNGRSSQSSIIIADITHIHTHTTMTTQHISENTGKKHRSTNGHIYTIFNKPPFDVKERIGHKHFIILLFLFFFIGRAQCKERGKKNSATNGRYTDHRNGYNCCS